MFQKYCEKMGSTEFSLVIIGSENSKLKDVSRFVPKLKDSLKDHPNLSNLRYQTNHSCHPDHPTTLRPQQDHSKTTVRQLKQIKQFQLIKPFQPMKPFQVIKPFQPIKPFQLIKQFQVIKLFKQF